MGRKNRGNRRKGDDDDAIDDDANHQGQDQDSRMEHLVDENTNHDNTGSPPSNVKDMDFRQRQELQRQQAADKRRAKQKCYLCGKAGHVRRQCPGVQDDGRGMSRFKGKSNPKLEKQKYQARKNSKSDKEDGTATTDTMADKLEYPDLQDIRYFDISADLNATLEYLKQGRGKAKISQKEALAELQHALECAQYLGGIISKTFLKPSRPWIEPSLDIGTTKTWYSVGLARDYLYNDNEMDAAIAALVETRDNHKDLVVGYWATLDFSPDVEKKRPGYDRESQLRRVHATCQAAGQTGIPVQLQVLPGAAGLDPEESVAGTDYAQALLDLQEVLSTNFTLHPSSLKIILSSWSGMAKHMMTFLNAFSAETLFIGMDGAVSFAKASNLHECAFEVPLNRLVLEASAVIPAEVANNLGRDAFFHPGLWPFVAKAVAHYKRTVSVADVARETSENTMKLYPQLAAAENNISSSEDQHEPEEGGTDDDMGDNADTSHDEVVANDLEEPAT